MLVQHHAPHAEAEKLDAKDQITDLAQPPQWLARLQLCVRGIRILTLAGNPVGRADSGRGTNQRQIRHQGRPTRVRDAL